MRDGLVCKSDDKWRSVGGWERGGRLEEEMEGYKSNGTASLPILTYSIVGNVASWNAKIYATNLKVHLL